MFTWQLTVLTLTFGCLPQIRLCLVSPRSLSVCTPADGVWQKQIRTTTYLKRKFLHVFLPFFVWFSCCPRTLGYGNYRKFWLRCVFNQSLAQAPVCKAAEIICYHNCCKNSQGNVWVSIKHVNPETNAWNLVWCRMSGKFSSSQLNYVACHCNLSPYIQLICCLFCFCFLSQITLLLSCT